MKKIKAFTYIFFQSLTSPVYYHDVINTNLWLSIKYYFTLAIVIATLITGIQSFSLVPEIITKFYNFTERSKDFYPKGLVIEFKDNAWTINQEEPLFIKMPESQNDLEGAPENLIVFDHAGEIEDLKNYNTLIIINTNNIIVKEANDFRVFPLKDIPDARVDRGTYDNFVNQLTDLFKLIPYFVFLAGLVASIYYLVGIRMIYLAIISLLLWVLTLATKKSLTYKQTVQICLHTITLPLLIESVLICFDVYTYNIPWFMLLNLVLGIFVVYKLDNVTKEKL